MGLGYGLHRSLFSIGYCHWCTNQSSIEKTATSTNITVNENGGPNLHIKIPRLSVAPTSATVAIKSEPAFEAEALLSFLGKRLERELIGAN